MHPRTPRVNDFQFPKGLRLETGQIGSQDEWPAAGSSGVDGFAGASDGLQQNCYRREAGGTSGRSGDGRPRRPESGTRQRCRHRPVRAAGRTPGTRRECGGG